MIYAVVSRYLKHQHWLQVLKWKYYWALELFGRNANCLDWRGARALRMCGAKMTPTARCKCYCLILQLLSADSLTSRQLLGDDAI